MTTFAQTSHRRICRRHCHLGRLLYFINVRRAREILEQLRNRANGQGLTESERGYIDRLLRGLY